MAGAERRLATGRFDELAAAEVYGRYMLGVGTDHLQELDRPGRQRIFNLGYYTWVEQQGVPLSDFDARRDPVFWDGLMDLVPVWDGMIDDFNEA
jgi:cysteine synthase A